jgi:26S proteasome regulatory subunit N1
MTYSDTGKRDTLYYRLISQSSELPGSWGHEYVRHLAAELGEEYNAEFAGKEDDEVKEEPTANGESAGAHSDEESRKYSDEQLKGLAGDLVDFFLKHNAEADAVDLLLEVEDIKSLVDKVNDMTWPRVCQYMVK